MSSRPVCAITGGTSGIGLATARRFAAAGYDLALCARNAKALGALGQEIEAEFQTRVYTAATDLTETGAAARFISGAATDFGSIDVLVNNAGLAPNCPVESFRDEDFAAAVSLNITAVFEATRAVWPIMKKAKGGVIVGVSSLAAIDPFPGFSVYGGTKAFVETFTQAIADEGRGDGIRAYCVRPGAVDTPLLRSLFPDFPNEQRLDPSDVAAMIFGLCSESMRHSSGEAVTIKK